MSFYQLLHTYHYQTKPCNHLCEVVQHLANLWTRTGAYCTSYRTLTSPCFVFMAIVQFSLIFNVLLSSSLTHSSLTHQYPWTTTLFLTYDWNNHYPKTRPHQMHLQIECVMNSLLTSSTSWAKFNFSSFLCLDQHSASFCPNFLQYLHWIFLLSWLLSLYPLWW